VYLFSWESVCHLENISGVLTSRRVEPVDDDEFILFVTSLFNDALSVSDYTASNDRMITNY
jgi:hypothetical protein